MDSSRQRLCQGLLTALSRSVILEDLLRWFWLATPEPVGGSGVILSAELKVMSEDDFSTDCGRRVGREPELELANL